MTAAQQQYKALWIPAAGLAVLAIAYKWILLAIEAFPFNADEAIVGLMARHTLLGSWPAFFYGQAYMGSLDASLVALAFAVFGQEIIAIRAVQILLYAGTVLTTIFLARQIFRSNEMAVLAGLLMALPTVNTTLYTTVSLGGYGEAILIGNLLMTKSTDGRERSNHALAFPRFIGPCRHSRNYNWLRSSISMMSTTIMKSSHLQNTITWCASAVVKSLSFNAR